MRTIQFSPIMVLGNPLKKASPITTYTGKPAVRPSSSTTNNQQQKPQKMGKTNGKTKHKKNHPEKPQKAQAKNQ